MVCLKTLISGIKSLENDSRKDAIERMCRECVRKDDESTKPEGDPGPTYTYRVACWTCFDDIFFAVSQQAAQFSVVEVLPLACSRQSRKDLTAAS